jgi:spore cortex biosynthesis protein YabQ
MILIVEQVYVFLYAIIGGAIAAFFYDILRIKRRAVKTNVLLVGLEDIIYWLAAAVFLFITVYKSNSGEMRGYIFIGNLIGVMLYESLLSKIVIKFSVTFINITKRVIMFTAKMLSYPFRFIYKVFKPVIMLVAKLISGISKAVIGKVSIANGKVSGHAKKRILSIKKKLGNIRKNT